MTGNYLNVNDRPIDTFRWFPAPFILIHRWDEPTKYIIGAVCAVDSSYLPQAYSNVRGRMTLNENCIHNGEMKAWK